MRPFIFNFKPFIVYPTVYPTIPLHAYKYNRDFTVTVFKILITETNTRTFRIILEINPAQPCFISEPILQPILIRFQDHNEGLFRSKSRKKSINKIYLKTLRNHTLPYGHQIKIKSSFWKTVTHDKIQLSLYEN